LFKNIFFPKRPKEDRIYLMGKDFQKGQMATLKERGRGRDVERHEEPI